MPQVLRLLTEIYRAFDFFNERFANNQLKQPIIVISSTGEVPMCGWFGVKAWKQDEQELDEINICAEHLDREPIAIIATLLHEMAHLKNSQAGLVDCDLDNQYHNELFKVSAESFGLTVRKRGKKGYAYTDVGPQALQAILDLNLDSEAFKGLYRKK